MSFRSAIDLRSLSGSSFRSAIFVWFRSSSGSSFVWFHLVRVLSGFICDLNLANLDETSEHGIKLSDAGDSDFDIVERGLHHRRGILNVLAIHLPPSSV
ncbi:hypothetical protein U1Q18_025290 [Sarracenia purpurea var. burkii]